jgi:transposase
VTLRLYGKQATLKLKTRVVIQRTFGVRIRLVAVQWEERPFVYLFSTDTTMAPEAIVEAYCARFAIETGFRDAKQTFRLSTYQVRNEQSIVRLVHLCLWAQTLLRLVYWQQKPQPIYGEWRKPLGYLTLAQQKRLSQQTCQVSGGSWATLDNADYQGTEPLAA